MYGADFLPVLSQTRPEPLPRRHMLYGRVARIDEAYGRDVRVTSHLLAGVLGAAGVARGARRLLAAALGVAPPGGEARRWKDLRKGPEFQVTQVWLTDVDGAVWPMEVHGYLGPASLVRGDRVRAAVRRQRDPYQPHRAVLIENLSTGRTLRPRGATVWTHLGPALLLQAAIGLGLLGLAVLAVLFPRH